ncbi:cyd operon YbgE family protein [Undibacterium sp. MH2W]|uniref:cyd operon YbgE family protein n=1 Tax=Undibacterium sp. MH2W TaxID=3413044 RepID=UPI003BF21ABB
MKALKHPNWDRLTQLSCLAMAIVIMLAGTAYPLVMVNSSGKVDHRFASILFLAMSIGFVRGVGFIPSMRILRWLLSGWTCFFVIVLAIFLKIYT